MRLILFEPDIPQNTAALIRLCACFQVGLDIIEPCGFVLSDKNLRRVAMDYVQHAEMVRYPSWEDYSATPHQGRLILLTTKTNHFYHTFDFKPDDRLLLGRESAGVPPHVVEKCDVGLKIPLSGEMRSLNVAMSGAIVLSEALKQTGGYQHGT